MLKGIKLGLLTGTLLALVGLAAIMVFSSLNSPVSASNPPAAQPTTTAAATAESGTTTSSSTAPGTSSGGANSSSTTAAPTGPGEVGAGNGTVVVAAPAPGIPAGATGSVVFANGDGSEMQGEITKIENNGTKLTIFDNFIINLNDQTAIGDAKGTLKASDLKVGDRVMALGKPEKDKSLTARWLLKLADLPVVQFGKISSIDAAANSFKFTAEPDSIEWTATVNSDTKLNNAGKEVKLGDLKAGDQVVVVGKADKAAHKIEANSVQAGMPMPVAGVAKAVGPLVSDKVKSVDTAGKSFTLENGQKVVVDDKTQFGGKDLKALSDLKVGDQVVVTGEKQSDGSLLARTISTVTMVNLEGGQSVTIEGAPGEAGISFSVAGPVTAPNGPISVQPAAPAKTPTN